MKKIYLILLILIAASHSHAQLEASKWYFGYQAALDFSSGAPVVLFDSQMSQWEGSASIADHDGNLLFYTDGLSVWNKNHNIMPNGTGMLGDPSSTQSAIIVPKPGTDSIYYIFVTSGTTAHYSELDMSLDGGLGDLNANKNILLSNNSAEKLAGVQASNGTDFWVSIHENSSATFLSYYVDATGVNTTAVSSTVGNSLVGNIGQLQFSPDGTRAAMASYSSFNSETIEVFDFDAATGTFSNQIGLPTSYFQTYGLEFSPSGKLLYTGADPDVYEIHQWNLAAGSLADIIASNTVVGTTLGTNGSLQLATDGKIYMAFESSNYLGVVNNPDSLGLACNWDATGVDLSPKSVGLGLPDFLASYFPSSPVSPVNFSVDQPEVCQKFCVNFTDASAVAGVSWLWNFEGGSPPTSTVQDPQNICYNLPGTYDVTLIVTEANGNSDTLTSPDYITVFATPPFPTITQNGYALTSSPAATYQWKLNLDDIPGATNQSYDVLQTGYYTVLVHDSNGCSNSANLYVQIVGIDEVNAFNFSAFPNPSSGLLTITWPNNLPNDELKLEVFNALGQLIYSSEGKFSTKNNFELNLSDRAPGVYLVKLRTNEFLANKKINLIH